MRKIPVFKTEAEERAFWQNHDSTEYVDWAQAKEMALPKLKPSTKTISLRSRDGCDVRTVTITEFIRHMKMYIDAAEQGETVGVTRRGKLIAKVQPVEENGRSDLKTHKV